MILDNLMRTNFLDFPRICSTAKQQEFDFSHSMYWYNTTVPVITRPSSSASTASPNRKKACSLYDNDTRLVRATFEDIYPGNRFLHTFNFV